jgi:hypothetical protein
MANRKQKKNNIGQRKLSKAQMEARQQAAIRREQEAKAAKDRSDRKKKIFTIVVCVILVLALGIPTVALSVLSGS